jgi:hypothetical protein
MLLVCGKTHFSCQCAERLPRFSDGRHKIPFSAQLLDFDGRNHRLGTPDGMMRLDTIFAQRTNRRVCLLVQAYMRRENRLIRREEHTWSLASVSLLTPLMGASDAATVSCPSFSRRSRHHCGLVATRAHRVGLHYRLARRLHLRRSTRARNSAKPKSAASVCVPRATGAAMTTLAMLIGWLMAYVSTGPLLLVILMLVLLRDRAPKRASADSRTRKSTDPLGG